MRGLKGKTAIVTGGAAGIGAAIVERFEAEGTRVVVFDLNPQDGQQKVDMKGAGSPDKLAEAYRRAVPIGRSRRQSRCPVHRYLTYGRMPLNP